MEETQQPAQAQAAASTNTNKDNMNMNDLLASYEEDLGIEEDDAAMTDYNNDAGATIAQEVNLLKQVSEQQLEVALKHEMSLQHGESIDQYMNTERCE